MTIHSPKKLIEVALPLDSINAACAYEKMPGIGAHPRGIHLWWARRPLAAARAVIFAQMVNDPSTSKHGQEAERERERLFRLIEDLVKWENTNNEDVLNRARREILRSWQETCELNKHHPDADTLFNPEKLPAFNDPFAGGGAIPLEAQRLGLEAWASDLNPVAVTINKAMIEIPPKFAGNPPVAPVPAGEQITGLVSWKGAAGLAEDVRRYGLWMREKAQERIGHFYPKVKITAHMVHNRPDLQEYVNKELTVIAWIWARTVASPNPIFSHVHVPLASTFVLSSKKGKEAYLEPVINDEDYSFAVRVGKPPEGAKSGTKLARGAKFRCLLSESPIEPQYIKDEGQAGRMGQRLLAIVLEGSRGRVYVEAQAEHEALAKHVSNSWKPAALLSNDKRNFWTPSYGLTSYGDLFTPRQLLALNTFSDLVHEAIDQCERDAVKAGMDDDGVKLDDGGVGARAYAEAVGVYLAFTLDRCADFNNSCTRWISSNQKVMNLFAKQAIAMTWDYPEANILEEYVGSFTTCAQYVGHCINRLPMLAITSQQHFATQQDAATSTISQGKLISTDPPYYDNISYADLSDFFYLWLRKGLKPIFPSLFTTLSVPKAEELIASPYRHGGREAAEHFFLSGMTEAIRNLAQQSHPAFPVSIYYAFKQSDTQTDGTSSTGWETFLEAVIEAGFAITGTWPLRSEQSSRMIASGTNALASSIVLVCRKRESDAPSISRREFQRELDKTLPSAFSAMTRGGVNSPVAPVDLSQAIIGPGMAIFSKSTAVLDADGTPMGVKTALRIINRFFGGDEGFDAETLFALQWFEQYSWAPGSFGEADVLARAKGMNMQAVVDAGIVESGDAKVRHLRWQKLSAQWDIWDIKQDAHISAWEGLHRCIASLHKDGEQKTGEMLARLGSTTTLNTGLVRALAYRLYTLCERTHRADDARAYNECIISWPHIEQAALAFTERKSGGEQGSLF